MSNWYDEALDEFMFDLAIHAKTTKATAISVYESLSGAFGLIDYDTMKEFLRDQYTEEDLEDEDECE